jgi:hypothetical protein
VCPLSYLHKTLIHAKILQAFLIRIDGKSAPYQGAHRASIANAGNGNTPHLYARRVKRFIQRSTEIGPAPTEIRIKNPIKRNILPKNSTPETNGARICGKWIGQSAKSGTIAGRFCSWPMPLDRDSQPNRGAGDHIQFPVAERANPCRRGCALQAVYGEVNIRLCPQRFGLYPVSRRWENKIHQITASGLAQGSLQVIEVVQSAVIDLKFGEAGQFRGAEFDRYARDFTLKLSRAPIHHRKSPGTTRAFADGGHARPEM